MKITEKKHDDSITSLYESRNVNYDLIFDLHLTLLQLFLQYDCSIASILMEEILLHKTQSHMEVLSKPTTHNNISCIHTNITRFKLNF